MNALILPIAVPFATAVVLLFFRRSDSAQRIVGAAGAVLLCAVNVGLLWQVSEQGILTLRAGGWTPPFGIVLVADLFAAIMLVLAGIIAVAAALYSVTSIDKPRTRHGYYSIFHFLMMGICGAFLTGDLFNLYVWFEVMLISSFVLLTLGGEREQIEGGIKYVTLNLISSAIFLAAAGVLYGFVGTLNMADVSVRLAPYGDTPIAQGVMLLFLVAFAIKAAMFPLFFWLPASYHTPPVAVSAVFAGLLTKVGVYAIVRVVTTVFPPDISEIHQIIVVVSALTMLTGVLGAIAQSDVRRILSFHIISQIGFMTLGAALLTPLALAGAIFYIAHHILVKSNLFLVSGVMARISGSHSLHRTGGLYLSHPVLAVLFLIPALSLSGMPPLSGFFAKLVILQQTVSLERWIITAVALLSGILTLVSMTKIWAEGYWAPAPADMPRHPVPRSSYIPVIFLAALTLAVTIFARPLLDLSRSASAQLLSRSGYIEAVMR